MLKKLNFAIGYVSGIDGTTLTLKAGHSITTDTGETNKFRAVFFAGNKNSPLQDTNREIVEAYRTDTNTFELTREQEGTSAGTWTEDDHFMLIASAGVFDEYETEIDTKADDADVIKKDGSVDYTGNQSMDFNDLEDVNKIDVSGYIELPEDGGAVTIIDLPQNTATVDTEQSYAFQIGGITILKVKALADGTGGIKTESLEVEGLLQLREGEAGAGTAPIKFKNGVLNTAEEEGAFETDGTDLYFTPFS